MARTQSESPYYNESETRGFPAPTTGFERSMLFRKNTPEQPHEPEQGASGFSMTPNTAMGEQSVFAPGLNPRSAPIDFGFDRVPAPPQQASYVVPAPPPDSQSQPQAQPQPEWGIPSPAAGQDYLNQVAAPPQEYYDTPMQPPLTTSTDYGQATAWQEPAQPAATFNAPVEDPAYLAETFENYSAQAQSIELEFESAMNWQPPSESVDSFELSPSFEGMASLSNISGMDISMADMPELIAPTNFEPASSGFESFEQPAPELPVYPQTFSPTTGEPMPWEQPESFTTPEQFSTAGDISLSQMVTGDNAPGGQMSMSPGELLDSMHQQLYPEDPFSADMVEGQQAFEEAAQFLFPDTMNASLDWQVEDGLSSLDDGLLGDFQGLGDLSFSNSPMELGPSVQRDDDSTMSDISSLYSEGMPPTPVVESIIEQSVQSPVSLSSEQELSLLNPDDASFGLGPQMPFQSFETPAPAYLSPNAFGEESSLYGAANFSAEESFSLSEPGIPGAEEDFVSLQWNESTPGDYAIPAENELTFEETAEWSPTMELQAETSSWEVASAENWQPSGDMPPALSADFSQSSTPPESDFSIEAIPADPFGDNEFSSWEAPSQPPIFEPQTVDGGESELFGHNAAEESWGVVDNTDYNPEDTWLADEELIPPLMAQPPGSMPAISQEPVLPESVSLSAMPLSDQDFYATDFTLNEFGELVPAVDETPMHSVLEMSYPTPALEVMPIQPEESSVQFVESPTPELSPVQPEKPSIQFVEPLAPEMTLEPVDDFMEGFPEPAFDEPFSGNLAPEPTFLSTEAGFVEEWSPVEQSEGFPVMSPEPMPIFEEFVGDEPSPVQPQPLLQEEMPASPFAQAALPPVQSSKPAAPELVQSPAPVSPLVQPKGNEPVDSLEAQWQEAATLAAEPPSTVQPGTVTPPSAFTLGNLEVLGVCPLSEDRRLLVVQSNGMYALMGQVGVEHPQISVLKVFANNPLVYQNTFTAVAEAQAAAQGMFVAQVGTWHAIVSTFQDKITLHTELG